MSLANWIARQQKISGCSSLELAIYTGLSRATLFRLKDPQSVEKPRLSTIRALERFFGSSYKPTAQTGLVNDLEWLDEAKYAPKDRIYKLQDKKCIICQSSLESIEIGTFFCVNPSNARKSEFFNYLSEEEIEETMVLTCGKCSVTFQDVCGYSYQTLVNIILGEPQGRFTTIVSDYEAGSNHKTNIEKAVSNQSLLALKLNTQQSTLSRIINKKIDWIDGRIAKELHVLCARRILNAKSINLPRISKEIALSILQKHFIQNYSSPQESVILNYRYEKNRISGIGCDLLLVDKSGDNQCAVFVLTQECERYLDSHYIGIGILLQVKFISIYILTKNSDVLHVCPVTYQIDQNYETITSFITDTHSAYSSLNK